MQPSYRGFPQQPPLRSPHAAVARRGIGPMIASGHPQTSMTANQMATQQAALDRASDLAKRRSRKPTDKNLPEGVEECVIGDGVQRYRDLRDMERKLDAAMMRKRLDIQDSRNRNVKRYRTLRLWISNTVEDQAWQGDDPLDIDINGPFDFANSDASYRVKIEGRLLDDVDELDDSDVEDEEISDGTEPMNEDGKETKTTKTEHHQKFSQFFKSMSVDFDRTRTKDGLDNSVEWKKPATSPNASNPPNAADFDQLEFKRNGDENVNININLIRDETQERFRLSPVLAEILDTDEATRAEAVTGVLDYVNMMGLQEDDEKRTFRCDDRLKVIFGRETGYVPFVTDAIGPQMFPLPPIKLAYTIRVDQEFHKDPQPTIYDIRVTLDDPLRAKLLAFNQNPLYPTTLREITALNDQLAILVQAVLHSKAKQTFLTSMSKDPVTFLRKWISSQKRDLEVLMGEATRGGGEDASGDEWRRGGPSGVWVTENVRESVNLMLSTRAR